MYRKSSTYYYEVTRKNPGTLKPGSIKALIYQTMVKLRRAEEDQIVDRVLASKRFRTVQEKKDAQVRWYLRWGLLNEGLIRRRPTRRYVSPRAGGTDDAH